MCVDPGSLQGFRVKALIRKICYIVIVSSNPGTGNTALDSVETGWEIIEQFKSRNITGHGQRNKNKFLLVQRGSVWNRQTPDEGRKIKQPKRCDHNNKYEEIILCVNKLCKCFLLILEPSSIRCNKFRKSCYFYLPSLTARSRWNTSRVR